jgi:hypothetical protein
VLHCLSVIDNTHLRDQSVSDRDVSLCGLMIAEGTNSMKFAADGDAPSCPRCRLSVATNVRSDGLLVLPPKSIIVAVLEHGLSTDSPEPVTRLLASDSARFLDAVGRLHALFPGWSAEIVTLMAEGDRLFASYRVICDDPNHLLWAQDSDRSEIIESAIFYISRTHGPQPRLVRVQPINDRFGIWISTGLCSNHNTR